MTILFYLKPHYRHTHIGPPYGFVLPKKKKRKVYRIVKEARTFVAEPISMKEVATEFIAFQREEKRKAKQRQQEEEIAIVILLL